MYEGGALSWKGRYFYQKIDYTTTYIILFQRKTSQEREYYFPLYFQFIRFNLNI